MSNFGVENVSEVEKIIGYGFKNKSLLVQAFTRRSYGVESGTHTDNEVLEFLGDRAVDYVLIRCMIDQYSEINPDSALQCSMKEGSLNRQMIRFKEGDYEKGFHCRPDYSKASQNGRSISPYNEIGLGQLPPEFNPRRYETH